MREVSSVVRLRRHHVIRNGHAHHDASDNTPSDTSKGAHAGRVGELKEIEVPKKFSIILKKKEKLEQLEGLLWSACPRLGAEDKAVE